MPAIEPLARQSKALRAATGRDYADWFGALDAWGAAGRPYPEIAGWLTGDHGVSDWWAQKLIVEYEQARGVRDPGARRDGTFSGGASKAIAANADRIFEAFADPGLRERWLPGVDLRERPTRAAGSRRFDWLADGTRISVTVAPTSAGTAQVAVEHERLPQPESAAACKVYWRERLTALRALLET